MITTSKTIFKRYIIINDNNENYYLVDRYGKSFLSSISFTKWLKELKAYSITSEQCQMIEKNYKSAKENTISASLSVGIGFLLYRFAKPYIELIHYDASKMFYAILVIISLLVCIIPIIYFHTNDKKKLTRIIELDKPKYIKLSHENIEDESCGKELKEYLSFAKFAGYIFCFIGISFIYLAIHNQDLISVIISFIAFFLLIICGTYSIPFQPITKINIIDKGDK